MWEALGDYRGPRRIDAFTRYVVAKRRRDSIEKSYRVYVTDSLMYAPQMMYMSKRWADWAYGKATQKDARSAEDIVSDITARIEGR